MDHLTPYDLIARKRKGKVRIVFPESSDQRILRAASLIMAEGIAMPILLGNKKNIIGIAKKFKVPLKDVQFCQVKKQAAQKLKKLGKDCSMIGDPVYYAAAMVALGEADAAISGSLSPTSKTIKAALSMIGAEQRISSYFLMRFPHKDYVFADCAINID